MDKAYLAAAIDAARQGLYSTSPNPRVGCLIVKDGQVVGRGAHMLAGGPHAEVIALANAGQQARGACAYVSLEPCCAHGRTGPCTDALIEAGIARVVSALVDPDPRMKGRGLKRLRDAGIEVVSARLPMAMNINQGYLKRMQLGMPWVRIKLAMSIDGRSAMASGESQWISGESSRRDVQYWRARSCAVITGSGTIRSDNPRLTVRDPRYAANGQLRQPLRVVVTSKGDVSGSALAFADAASSLLVAGELPRAAAATWQSLGVEVLHTGAIPVEIEALLRSLAERGCNEVLVEAGPTLAGRFIEAGLWDEAILYMAPMLLGSDARALFNLPIEKISGAIRGHIVDARAMGQDLRVTLKRA